MLGYFFIRSEILFQKFWGLSKNKVDPTIGSLMSFPISCNNKVDIYTHLPI